MPRGGRREKAGRKSTWKSGRRVEKTTIIRVPVEFSQQLLRIAHKLDAGEPIDLDTESNGVQAEKTIDFVTEPKEVAELLDFDFVVKSIKALFLEWDAQAQEDSQKTADLGKAYQLLDDLKVFLSSKNDSVTDSESAKQLELEIENDAQNELVTESEDSTVVLTSIEGGSLSEIVTNSKDSNVVTTITQEQDLPELVTNSESDIHKVSIEPISNKLMGRRISALQPTMSNKRRQLSEEQFLSWVNSKDPDKIRWVLACEYSDRFLKYLPERDTPSELLSRLMNWIDQNP